MTKHKKPWAAPMKGLGIIKCEACGKPLKNHSLMEGCPELRNERITVAKPKRQRRADR